MKAAIFVHPSGLCESESVGSGTRIWAFAHVLEGAVVGKDCNVCDGAYIESDVVIGDRVTIKNGVMLFDGARIGDDVFLGPGVVFTNDLNPRSRLRDGTDHLLAIEVKRGATVGANATVICGTVLGEYSFIGAGAVVTSNVPAHALMLGTPARRVGWACRCGHRLDEKLVCQDCGHRYRQDGDSLITLDAVNPS
ncbi:MAG TPA: acyltransferase [Solirubrobacterales bacterium]|nr:acyltransferase [Solirubrobacterales bacterium]